MVRLLSLYAYDFKKLKFKEPIDFPDGVILINGPNESGKSSILDAILYALFGKVIRPPVAEKEAIITYGANRAIVELTFAVEDRKFRVRRETLRRGPSRARLDELLPDGSPRRMATKFNSVTKEVEGILGDITFNEIVSSNVVAQKDLARLIEQRRDDRRKVINVFLNLESFNKVLSELDEKRKELGGTGRARPGKISIEREKLDELRRQLDEFNQKKEDLVKLAEQIDKESTRLDRLRERLNKMDPLLKSLTSYDEVETKRAELSTAIKGKEALLSSHRDQITKLKEDLQSLQEHLQSYSNLDDARAALHEVKAKLKEVEELQIKIRETEEQRSQIESEVQSLEAKFHKLGSMDIEAFRRGSQGLRLPALGCVASFVVGALLLFFEVPIVPWAFIALAVIFLAILVSRASRIGRLARVEGLLGQVSHLESRKEDLSRTHKALANFNSTRSTLEQDILDSCGKIRRYESIFTGHPGIEAMRLAGIMLEAAEREAGDRSSLRSQVEALERQLSQAPSHEAIAKQEEELTVMKEQLDQLHYPPLPMGVTFTRELLKKTRSEREELLNEISRLDEGMSRDQALIKQIETYLEEHKDTEQRFSEQEMTVHQLQRRLRIVTKAIEGIEKTAEALRNRVKPGVERYMGIILPDVTAGTYKAVRIDEDYNLRVWDPEAGEFRSRDTFSGGAEDQFLLSMRLAFASALLPEVKGLRPEFLFLDEPLGSSDEVRRTGILEHITTKLRKQFRQIFLISHLRGIEEYAENVISVEDGQVVQQVREARVRSAYEL